MSTSRPSTRRPQHPRPAPPEQLPLQYTPFSVEHFKTKEGLATVNQFLQQLTIAMNASNGTAGPVTLPRGLNMRGATVTGLGAPAGPTDAVSQSHVQSNYSAPVVGPQLDIGGSSALSGLTALYLNRRTPFSEVPQGTLDGTNTTFHLSYAPYICPVTNGPILILALNGVVQNWASGALRDITISQRIITYTVPPLSTDWHTALYWY